MREPAPAHATPQLRGAAFDPESTRTLVPLSDARRMGPRTLHKPQRRRDARRIRTENAELRHRVAAQEPQIETRKELEEDFARAEHHLRTLSQLPRFPLLPETEHAIFRAREKAKERRQQRRAGAATGTRAGSAVSGASVARRPGSPLTSPGAAPGTARDRGSRQSREHFSPEVAAAKGTRMRRGPPSGPDLAHSASTPAAVGAGRRGSGQAGAPHSRDAPASRGPAHIHVRRAQHSAPWADPAAEASGVRAPDEDLFEESAPPSSIRTVRGRAELARGMLAARDRGEAVQPPVEGAEGAAEAAVSAVRAGPGEPAQGSGAPAADAAEAALARLMASEAGGGAQHSPEPSPQGEGPSPVSAAGAGRGRRGGGVAPLRPGPGLFKRDSFDSSALLETGGQESVRGAAQRQRVEGRRQQRSSRDTLRTGGGSVVSRLTEGRLNAVQSYEHG